MATDFQASAEAMKDQLKTISPSFCSAKWLMTTLHLENGQTHSCFLPQSHAIPLEGLAENPAQLHNTPHKLARRKEMLEGVKPEECSLCWQVETNGGLSDRFYRSGEAWAAPELGRIARLPWNEMVNPRHLEVSFGSQCNFKCSYCSPMISSKWREEIRSQGPYPIDGSFHNDLSWLREQNENPHFPSEDNPYIDAFWKWWPSLYKELKVVRLTGGEPLLNKNTFRVFDWIRENPKPDLELAITTNLCVPSESIHRFLENLEGIGEKKIGQLRIYVSLDAWGEQAEYIRFGMNFMEMERNLHQLMRRIPWARVGFIHTMSALSIVGVNPFLKGFAKLRNEYPERNGRPRINFDTPILREPAHLSARILPAEYIAHVDRALEFMQENEFMDFQISRMRRLKEWLQEPLPADIQTSLRKSFRLFFEEHDRRRGTNFLATFPEMEKFWQECF